MLPAAPSEVGPSRSRRVPAPGGVDRVDAGVDPQRVGGAEAPGRGQQAERVAAHDRQRAHRHDAPAGGRQPVADDGLGAGGEAGQGDLDHPVAHPVAGHERRQAAGGRGSRG